MFFRKCMPARGPRPGHGCKGKGSGKGEGHAVASPPTPTPVPGSDGAAGPAVQLRGGINDAERSRLSSIDSNVLRRMTGEYTDVDDAADNRQRRSAYMYATTPFVTMAANGNSWAVDEAMRVEEDDEDEEQHGDAGDASRMGSVASLDIYGGGGGSSIYGSQGGDGYTAIDGDGDASSSSEDEDKDTGEGEDDYVKDMAPVPSKVDADLARLSTMPTPSAKQSIVSLVSLAFPDTYPRCDDVDTSRRSPMDYHHKHTPEADAALGFVEPRSSHFRTSRC